MSPLLPESMRSGVYQAIEDTVQSEWVTAWAYRQFERRPYSFNPDFKLTPELLEQLGEGLDNDQLDAFANAHSIAHAMKIREQQLTVSGARRRLGELGWTGTALRLGGAVLDPATWLAGGIAAPLAATSKASRLARMVQAGLVFGGTEAGLEAYLASQDTERGARDVLYAGAGAFALAGGAAAIFGPKLERAARGLRDAIEVSEAAEAGMTLTAKGERRFSRVAAQREQLIQALKQHLDIPEDELAELDTADLFDFAGELDIIPREQAGPLDVPLDFSNVDDVPQDATLIGKARFSISGMVGRSPSPTARRTMLLMAEDPLAHVAGKPSILSASEWVNRNHKRIVLTFERESNAAFKRWAREHDVPWYRLGAAKRDFMKEVGLTVRRDPAHASGVDPNVTAVANVVRNLKAELLGTAQRYRVKGFDDVPESPTYLMRVHDLHAIERAIATHGSDEVVRLIRESIIRASESLTDEAAEQIARGYLRSVRALRRTDIAHARLFSRDQAEDLRRIIREAAPQIDDATIEDIIFAGGVRDPETGLIARARRRLGLDETHEIQTGAGRLAIADLLVNDAQVLVHRYSHQVLGASAMSEVYRASRLGPDDVVEEFDTILKRVSNELHDAGESQGKIEKTRARLDAVYRSIVGLPLGENSTMADVLRLTRRFQFVRVMNLAGFAQIAEFGNVVAVGGWKATMQHGLPAFRKLVRRAADGKLEDPTLREIEAMIAAGTDWMRNPVLARMDHDGVTNELGGGHIEQMLRHGQRFTNLISGMAPINRWLQTSFAAVAIQKWADIAATGRGRMSPARLASMGLSEADAEQILVQMRRYMQWTKGVLGGKYRTIGIENWDDWDAAAKFITALDKWSRRGIQENDIANLSLWMTTDLGRTFVQFRVFQFAAWEKQFLYNLHQRDLEAFSAWSLTMLFGSLSHVARVYLLSLGQQDRERFLAERLSPEAIASAAYYRAGFSSLFPGIIDQAALIGGFDPVFAHARTTQLGTDFILGNPTVDWLNGLPGAMRGMVAPSRPDYQFSAEDMRELTRVMPFQNALGVYNVTRAIADELPRKSQEDGR